MREISGRDLDLRELVRPGDCVVCGQGTGEPRTLTEALVAQRADLGRLRVFLGTMFTTTFRPEHADHLDLAAWCAIGTNHRLARAGCLDVIVSDYSQLPGFFARRDIPCDVALIQVSAQDAQGRASVGTLCDYTLDAARAARVVIAEVNAEAPWCHDGEALRGLRIDAVVRTSRPLVEVPSVPPDSVTARVAANVAGLIDDGATLQMGFGAVADAVVRALRGHRGLAVHSGLVTDAIVDLAESGAVAAAPGAIVSGALFGTQRLNAFTARNAAVQLRPPHYTHDPAVLAALPKLTAINGATEVDLTGQVNAETVDGAYMGGVGGHGDFVRGALRSRGGRAIIALPSVTPDGRRSRIVTLLDGGVTTTPRSHADFVVTEHGVAELRGQSLRERTRRMIAIAAPEFRERLREACGASR